jgi:hypothetical protein
MSEMRARVVEDVGEEEKILATDYTDRHGFLKKVGAGLRSVPPQLWDQLLLFLRGLDFPQVHPPPSWRSQGASDFRRRASSSSQGWRSVWSKVVA